MLGILPPLREEHKQKNADFQLTPDPSVGSETCVLGRSEISDHVDSCSYNTQAPAFWS
jgi:hypothetical protein